MSSPPLSLSLSPRVLWIIPYRNVLVIAQIYIHPTTPTFGHCRYYTQVSGLVRELQGSFYSQHELKYDMYRSILYPIEIRKLMVQLIPVVKRKSVRGILLVFNTHPLTIACDYSQYLYRPWLCQPCCSRTIPGIPGIQVLCPTMLGKYPPPHPCLAC